MTHIQLMAKASLHALLYNSAKNVSIIILTGYLCSYFNSLYGIFALAGLLFANANVNNIVKESSQ